MWAQAESLDTLAVYHIKRLEHTWEFGATGYTLDTPQVGSTACLPALNGHDAISQANVVLGSWYNLPGMPAQATLVQRRWCSSKQGRHATPCHNARAEASLVLALKKRPAVHSSVNATGGGDATFRGTPDTHQLPSCCTHHHRGGPNAWLR
jgi:hypothetical protein